MADIFISYASEDRHRVRPLADALTARGFNVWWDRSLAAGHDYAAVIERELKNAKAVIVVWTQSSAASTFVRDEAGRARDEGRLVPVLLDNVQIPLGFGAFQAEDFTRWNGGANAPQMQILEEALKAKLEGRDVNAGEVARKRRRLMARIRIVSVLTVIALLVAIAWGVNDIITPEPPRTDVRAELLRLLEEGKLSPEQAIQLAQILESGAFETAAAMQAPSAADNAAPAPSPGPMMRSETAPGEAGVQLASVSEAEFDTAARDTYRAAIGALLRHPDASVRQATLELSNDATRDRAMQTLWAYAQANPEDPLRDRIYQVCGAVGEANDNPLGQRALEVSANLDPQDRTVWRMLARSYQRTNRPAEAQAAVLVSDAVQAQAEGQPEVAEQRLQEALPSLTAPQLRAPVVSELGGIAQSRQDWTSASARFAEAYRLREQAAQAAPTSGAAQALEA
ncbi:MAG: toll/interleukin-1 receptor domain-containing protein, partial [Hyphomonadaceae bacterium]|nr:toll/interleukin-1 receptor domain-containing protein [Hyphomonadaceae bacterium]